MIFRLLHISHFSIRLLSKQSAPDGSTNGVMESIPLVQEFQDPRSIIDPDVLEMRLR